MLVQHGRAARGALSLKRALPHIVMTVALLIAQQAAYEHALSHGEHSSPNGKQKHLPHTKACIKCGLSAQLGTGLLGNAVTFVPLARIPCGPLLLCQAFHPAPPRRFLSRAPPTPL